MIETQQRNLFGAGSTSVAQEVATSLSKSAQKREDKHVVAGVDMSKHWHYALECIDCRAIIPASKGELVLLKELKCNVCDPEDGRERLAPARTTPV